MKLRDISILREELVVMNDIPGVISEVDVAAFQRDGVICLPGIFADWVERLARGVERNMAEPGPYASENTVAGEAGRFFDDYCNWERIPEYRDFVLTSPAARLAARIMGSRTAQFFHEHVLVKEPGTAKPTPWHQDMPFYFVAGKQTVSMWIALDPVDRATCPQFIAGSHRWEKMVRPQHWLDESDFYGENDAYMDVPDVEADRAAYEIRAWDMAPGDAILFNYLTLHGAPGNRGRHRRRGFSARWVGDDAHYVSRPGRTSPPYPGIDQKDGERLREDWFPVVWPPEAATAPRG
jgi:ectoine hydroxylase-related dioxygenase (phytanoyl-CoA dioxygenase family)